MKKTLLTALLGTSLFFGTGEKLKAQDENNPYLNEEYKFYFEFYEPLSDGRARTNEDVPSPYHYRIQSWLCNCPKEDRKGFKWINFYDFEGDKFYDYISMSSSVINGIRVEEKFRFYPNEKKEIDYTLQFYKSCDGTLEDCENIINKEYSKITGEEAQSIGGDFIERINGLVTSQKNFNKFNTSLVENLLRKEANSWRIDYVDGKNKFVKTGFPIYRYLSEEEISKIESVIQE